MWKYTVFAYSRLNCRYKDGFVFVYLSAGKMVMTSFFFKKSLSNILMLQNDSKDEN